MASSSSPNPHPPKKLLVYSGPDAESAEKLVKKLADVLTPILQKDAYTFHTLHGTDFPTVLSAKDSSVAALILANFDRNSPDFNESSQSHVIKFVFNDQNAQTCSLGGKVMIFSAAEDFQQKPQSSVPSADATDSAATADAFWFLKSAFADKHESVTNVADLFRKFASRADIPVNRQCVQLTPNTQTCPGDEFTVGMARVENAVEYLDVCSESGSEIVLVAGSLEKILEQGPRVWADLAQTIDLNVATTSPQPPLKQAVAATAETVLIYTGKSADAERIKKLDAAVHTMLQPGSLKYAHLSQDKLKIDANLHKICKAILLAPDNSKEFDEPSRQNLLKFFTQGGKLMFFGETKSDPEWIWFLKAAFAPKETDFLGKITASFEKFSHGERIPTDMQSVQIPAAYSKVEYRGTGGADDSADIAAATKEEFPPPDFAVAMVKAENSVPVLYLSGQNAGTAAFAYANPEDVLEQSGAVWKDLLRIVDVNVLPGQDHRFTFGRMISRVQDDLIQQKPPNLFVYSPDEETFKKFASACKCLLRRDTYVVYRLPANQADSAPWAPYCRVLFVLGSPSAEQVDEKMRREFAEYFANGGKIMYFCRQDLISADKGSTANPLWLLKPAVFDNEKIAGEFAEKFKRFVQTNSLPTNLLTTQIDKGDKSVVEYYAAMLRVENAASVIYLAPDDKRAVAFVVGCPDYVINKNDELWRDLFRMLDLDVSANLQNPLTSGYLFCRNDEILQKTCTLLKAVTAENTPEMLFIKVSTDSGSPTFPIRVKETRKDFSTDLYFQQLKTAHLGEAVVFIPVARSLLYFAICLQHISDDLGVVVIAKEQLPSPTEAGKQWISPIGAATFSLNVKIPQKSHLGENIGFARCLATLAAVTGIKSTAAYAEVSKHAPFEIGLKWPDDVYYGKNIKIGGVLSRITKRNEDFIISLVFGINVSNKRPTACLNDFTGPIPSPFKIETVITAVLNETERLFLEASSTNGLQTLVKLFEENWVHLNQEVTVMKSHEKATLVGLNEDGSLKSKLANGEIVSLTSDPTVELCSNSLDCLIRVK